MIDKLLICTDLDRTLIPNGTQSESTGARQHFNRLVERPEVTLAYVSGRHRSLIEKAIQNYSLPQPDFVISDVGTRIYRINENQAWQCQTSWDSKIAKDWGEHSHGDLKERLKSIPALRIQESRKQNRFKLSYYVPLQTKRDKLTRIINSKLEDIGVQASLIWSIDEPNGIGLLDILPRSATKFHAVEELMTSQGFELNNTVFSGDSGNDLEVIVSPIPAVLVANSQEMVKQQALAMAASANNSDRVYIAQGNFMGMNGHYAAGILEGIAHYYPDTLDWMGFAGG